MTASIGRTLAATAAMIIAVIGVSSAQTAHTTASATKGTHQFMIVACGDHGYLVTDNHGATWRLIRADEVNQLPEEAQRALKATRAQAVNEDVIAAPNPTTGATTIRFTVGVAGPTAITVSDSRGAQVLRFDGETGTAGAVSQSVDLSSLPGGVYYYHITNGEGPVGSGVLTLLR